MRLLRLILLFNVIAWMSLAVHSTPTRTFLPFEHRIRIQLGPSNTVITQTPLMFLELAGVSLFDHDGDGDLDVYLTNGPGFPNALLENRNGAFVDVAEVAGVAFKGATTALAGDLDNDGDADLFLARRNKNVLYRNDGDGTFSDATRAAGVVAERQISISAALCDFDNDGLLDIYVGNFLKSPDDVVHQNLLYHNKGDLTFDEVAVEAGVAVAAVNTYIAEGRGQNTSWAATCLDYDLDGDADLAVAVDFSTVTLFANRWQETGRLVFEDVTQAAGLGTVGNWMGLAVGDFNGDLLPDLFATNWGNSPVIYRVDIPVDRLEHALYLNQGDGTFTQAAEAAGVAAWPFGWGATAMDWDNDGDLDLYYAGNFLEDPDRPVRDNTGHLFLNDGGGHFTEATQAYGVVNDDVGGANQVGHGVASGDLNGDGLLDLVVANTAHRDAAQAVYAGVPRYFENNTVGAPNHWLQVKLVGVLSNRDGVGAKVIVEAGGGRQVREVRAGSGHLGQDALTAGFGLGAHGVVERLEVRWPSGGVDVLTELAADQVVTVREGQSPR